MKRTEHYRRGDFVIVHPESKEPLLGTIEGISRNLLKEICFKVLLSDSGGTVLVHPNNFRHLNEGDFEFE